MLLLRHGQSLFNKLFTETRRDPGIEDPELTDLGQAQAQAAARQLEGQKITRIIVSPYTRALQTAEPVLAVHDVPVEVVPGVRERYAFACDIGSHRDVLAARFPRHRFDHLPERWWPDETETAEAAVRRAGLFRDKMVAAGDEQTTLVVSHWAFILALTGVSVTNGELLTYDPHAPAPERITWRP